MSKNLGIILAEDWPYLLGLIPIASYYWWGYYRRHRIFKKEVLTYAEILRQSETTMKRWEEVRSVLVRGGRERFAERVEKILFKKNVLE